MKCCDNISPNIIDKEIQAIVLNDNSKMLETFQKEINLKNLELDNKQNIILQLLNQLQSCQEGGEQRHCSKKFRLTSTSSKPTLMRHRTRQTNTRSPLQRTIRPSQHTALNSRCTKRLFSRSKRTFSPSRTRSRQERTSLLPMGSSAHKPMPPTMIPNCKKGLLNWKTKCQNNNCRL